MEILASQEPQKENDTLKSVPSKLLMPNYNLVGTQRIFVELNDKVQAENYSRQYTELVNSIAQILREQGITPKKEEGFITGVWGIINSNLGIDVQKDQFLSAAIQNNKWDCDVSATLVFDVARELGISVEFLEVPEHALICTDNYFFETTNGGYYPISELSKRYPIIYLRSSNPDEIIYIAHYNKGNTLFDLGKFQEAIAEYDKALAINPKFASAHNNKGNALQKLGKFQEAIAEYDKALAINPKFASAHYNKGNALRKLAAEKEE